MIIAVDLDEVLVDLVSPLLKYHNDKYGTGLIMGKIHSYNFWEVWGGTKEEAVRKFHDFYMTPYFAGLRPIPGSQKGVEALSITNKLAVVTSRPHVINNETIECVNKYFPQKFSGIHLTNQWAEEGGSRRKSDVCADLGIELMIDDSLEYAKDCASRGIEVLLLDYPWNQSNKLPENILRVRSWKEIVEQI